MAFGFTEDPYVMGAFFIEDSFFSFFIALISFRNMKTLATKASANRTIRITVVDIATIGLVHSPASPLCSLVTGKERIYMYIYYMTPCFSVNNVMS